METSESGGTGKYRGEVLVVDVWNEACACIKSNVRIVVMWILQSKNSS
jgi:hypothetical protein